MAARLQSYEFFVGVFVGVLASVLAIAVFTGCAPKPRTTASGAAGGSSSGVAPQQSDDAAVPSQTSAGVALLRWFVPSDPDRMRAGFEEAIHANLATRENVGLSSEGFTVLRTRREALPAILASFGGSNVIRKLQLGQPVLPATLAALDVGRGVVVLAGGRPAMAEHGSLRLFTRAWCFPTVDGARARLELGLAVVSARSTTLSLDPSDARDRMSEIAAARTILELKPDEALILAATPIAPPRSDQDDGPVAAMPPTRASLLCSETAFPDRSLVLVIVPSFGDMLPTGMTSIPAEIELSPEITPETTPEPTPETTSAP